MILHAWEDDKGHRNCSVAFIISDKLYRELFTEHFDLGIYELLTWNLVLLLQTFFSLYTGSAFIIIRNLVRDLEEKDDYLREISGNLYDLKIEVDKMKKAKASE